MSDDGILEWAKQQRLAWQRELRLLQDKKLFTSEERNGKVVNTTEETMAAISVRLENLDRLIARYESQ